MPRMIHIREDDWHRLLTVVADIRQRAEYDPGFDRAKSETIVSTKPIVTADVDQATAKRHAEELADRDKKIEKLQNELKLFQTVFEADHRSLADLRRKNELLVDTIEYLATFPDPAGGDHTARSMAKFAAKRLKAVMGVDAETDAEAALDEIQSVLDRARRS